MTDAERKKREEKARSLRYKKPALLSLGYDTIITELDDIAEACGDVHWAQEDDNILLSAFDGDEDDAYEFKMAFCELDAEANSLAETIQYDNYNLREYFDDCTVALLADAYQLVGYDDYQEDYYRLAAYEGEYALSEAGVRLMRNTKTEMLSKLSQCFRVAVAFLHLRQKYDYLSASIDILRGANFGILDTVKKIEAAYEKATGDSDASELDALLANLPDRLWLE